MRGRKPTPTFLRVIRGNPSKRAMPKREPVPHGDLLKAPEFLSDAQRRYWTQAIAALPPGLLKRSDSPLLAGFVMAYATAIECNDKMAYTSLVIGVGPKSSRVLMGNPYERIRRQNISLMVKIASEIGLSPVSRTRIELSPDSGAPDEWDEILGT